MITGADLVALKGGRQYGLWAAQKYGSLIQI